MSPKICFVTAPNLNALMTNHPLNLFRAHTIRFRDLEDLAPGRVVDGDAVGTTFCFRNPFRVTW